MNRPIFHYDTFIQSDISGMMTLYQTLWMSWTSHNDFLLMIQVVDVVFCIVAMCIRLCLHQVTLTHYPICLCACLMLPTSTGWLYCCNQIMQFVIYLFLLHASSLTNEPCSTLFHPIEMQYHSLV